MDYVLNFLAGFVIGTGVIIYIKKDKIYNNVKETVKDMVTLPKILK